ncbi:MAG TPA: sugar phosphate isomerase/epimerase [Gemmatimonadaceae bacterium]|nr:sugar phosphate isomerase/epimerase [Gemmatimonadaceae bacterium]
MTVSRRKFIQQSLTAVVGTSAVLKSGYASSCASAGGGEAKLNAVGLQLYTVREEMQKSVEATLARVAQIGYKEVEFAGFFGRSAQQIADALRANGLTSPASHVQYDPATWDRTLADAKTIGNEYVVNPWIPEQLRTDDGIKHVAEMMNTAAVSANAAGLKLAYHNHDFEFKPMASGKLIYDYLLENTDPQKVLMEMDLYWINHGGADPLAYWRKYPGRFPLVHVKDMKADRSMADVGSGTLPWAKYFHERALAGVKHFFVERDDAASTGDAFQAIANSYNYLKNLEF